VTLPPLVLFVHVTAVLTMFAALSFEALSLFHLRRVSNLTEVRHWIDPIPHLPWVARGSLLLVFLSGVYLTVRMEAFELAWPKVAVGALLLIAPLGALTGWRMRAIRRACVETNAINSELTSRLQDPFLKVSLSIPTLPASWHSPAYAGEAGFVGVDRHRGHLGCCWFPIVPAGLGSRWIAAGS
jgi:hypothetical protein